MEGTTLKIKTDWTAHLHEYRRREIEMIFSRCPDGLFASGLELGAGDGFQSRLLARYVTRLTATDLDGSQLPPSPTGAIVYRACDAEHLEDLFTPGQLDVIFSSNLLEHLPEPSRALRAIHQVLADDGVTIHVMPSPFWVLCHLCLYIPNKVVQVLEILTSQGGLARAGGRLAGRGRSGALSSGERPLGNNPKLAPRPRPALVRWLTPEPHGVSPTHWRELHAFRRSRWEEEFRLSGLKLIRVVKGPVASGYGFGFNRLRRILEGLGFASEYIYVACKEPSACRYAAWLGPETS